MSGVRNPSVTFSAEVQTRSTGIKLGKTVNEYKRVRTLAVHIPSDIAKTYLVEPGEEVDVVLIFRNKRAG